ncbi:protein of unknown function (plasmid) [Rhodovastum atsumiense]|nr:protein of unknown function [Rhodovastum atsumiense]
MDSSYLTVTEFFEDGRIDKVKSRDLLKPSYGYQKLYVYNDKKKLARIEITAHISNETAIEEFSYDGVGNLVGFRHRPSYMEPSGVLIGVTLLSDGRPKETIARDWSGKARWRVEYNYGNHSVMLRYFANEILGRRQTQSAFQLDEQGRPIFAEVTDRHGDAVDAEKPSFYGRYFYSYRADGSSFLDVGYVSNDGFYPGSGCFKHLEFFRNNDENEAEAKVNCRNNAVLGPGGWTNPPEKNEYRFDTTGNMVMRRSGKSVIELGRIVTNWNFEKTISVIYY